MAMKKVYHTVKGQLIAEETPGGGRIDYLTDALGSVTATVNQSAQVINTYRYKPFGGLLAKTGAGSDPAFQWVGGQGYRQTGKSYSEVYIRARHYSSTLGRWTTKDPFWPEEPAYEYGRSSSVFRIDPFGDAPISCDNIRKCLTIWNPQGNNCMNGRPGYCPGKGKVTVEIAMCMFYFECHQLDDTQCKPDDNDGGIGQLTLIALEDLCKWGCNRGIQPTLPKQTKGSNWCKAAQAAYNYVDCVGLKKYGPKYTDYIINQIKKCAKCIKGGGDCRACGKKYIGE